MSEPVRGPSGGGWLSRLFGGGSTPKLTKEQKTALKALETQKEDLLAQVKPLSIRIKSLSNELRKSENAGNTSIGNQLEETERSLKRIKEQIRALDAQIRSGAPTEMTSMGAAATSEDTAAAEAAAASSTDIADVLLPKELQEAFNKLSGEFSKDKLVAYYSLQKFQQRNPTHPFTKTIAEKFASIPRDVIQKAIYNSILDFFMLNKARGERERDVDETQFAAANIALQDKTWASSPFQTTTVRSLANEIITAYTAKFK